MIGRKKTTQGRKKRNKNHFSVSGSMEYMFVLTPIFMTITDNLIQWKNLNMLYNFRAASSGEERAREKVSRTQQNSPAKMSSIYRFACSIKQDGIN